ncbi:MAG: hypothetical protein Q8L60_10760 [Gammaproteobacteria bacterium]|nr:hypothetical protein [Gammaproteobacteria bacterium]MDP2346828.1 hypothetical protein [Gammaproteobacteria bacterium]
MKKTTHPWANRSLLQGVYFTLCLTEKQFNAVCKHLSVEADFNHSHHGTTYHFESGDKNVSVVVIRNWKDRDRNAVLGLIAHEAMHVWQETKRIIGETNPGREIEAYAMQNITQELFELYDKLSRKSKA